MSRYDGIAVAELRYYGGKVLGNGLLDEWRFSGSVVVGFCQKSPSSWCVFNRYITQCSVAGELALSQRPW